MSAISISGYSTGKALWQLFLKNPIYLTHSSLFSLGDMWEIDAKEQRVTAFEVEEDVATKHPSSSSYLEITRSPNSAVNKISS